MHSRGSGFFDFSYTTLTFGLLLVVLLFFATPSKAAQVTALVIAVFLLVDTILIVSVPRLRVEEGWVGIASVVWALLISIVSGPGEGFLYPILSVVPNLTPFSGWS